MQNSDEKTIILVVACISGFLSVTNMTAINIAVPAIGNEYTMSAVLLGWVTNSVTLVSAALLVPFGRLADIVGRKRVFEYGFCVTIFSSLLCATANSSVLFFVSRVIQGFGAAMILGTGVAIITSAFPAEERGKALGISTASIYLGGATGPFIGGILTQQIGWRSIFFMLFITSFFTLILALWKLKGEWAEARGEKFDVTGSTILILSIISLMYGLTVLTSSSGIILIIVGILGAYVFILFEKRARYPVLNIAVLKNNHIFIFSNLAILLNYTGFGAMVFLVSLYLQYIQGFSPQTAGIILLANSVLMAITATMAGRLSDRFQPQKIAALGLSINCIAFILFSFLNATTLLWFIIVCLAISGIGQGLFSTPNVKAILSSVNRDSVGVASGTQATTRTLGIGVSTCIIIVLFSLYIGEAQIVPEYYPAFLISTKLGFIISAILCFIAIFAQIAGGVRRQGGLLPK